MKDLAAFEPKRILVCQQRQIGDVLLATPVFAALRKRFPEAELHIMTEPKCEPLLRGNPDIDVFHLIDKKGGLLRQLAFYRSIAALGIDLVVNLQQLPRCRMLTMLSGAPVRLSFSTSFLKDLIYTHTRPEKKGYACMSKVALLEGLGITWNGEPPRIFLSDGEMAAARALLASCGMKPGERLITIDATHRRASKRWPGESYSELMRMLAGHDPSLRFMLLRGPGEDDELAWLRSSCPAADRFIIPDEVPDIRISAACIRLAALHIGNCSSPRHMAVAVDTPSLVIPGASGPGWTYPGPMHESLAPDLPCIPCDSTECDDMRCMTLVRPEAAFERACALMKTGPGPL
ncbi:MAG: glycosyltransferase family 9 protein [Mailhella sp.]|nr:glycosyltransferase family 9 protein [Mailhella sp.]